MVGDIHFNIRDRRLLMCVSFFLDDCALKRYRPVSVVQGDRSESDNENCARSQNHSDPNARLPVAEG
jgi:hypothetical protein